MSEIEILYAELLNNQNPLHCTRKELCDAVDSAAESLEKQIPKNPVEQQINPRGELIGLCPNCEEWWINKYYHFCPNCGQKLDWSENDG